MKRRKRYTHYTEVVGQRGPYIVKHTSKTDMERYQKKLKQQYPYFRLLKSGKMPRATKKTPRRRRLTREQKEEVRYRGLDPFSEFGI